MTCHPEPWQSHGEGPYDGKQRSCSRENASAACSSVGPIDQLQPLHSHKVPRAGFAATQDDNASKFFSAGSCSVADSATQCAAVIHGVGCSPKYPGSFRNSRPRLSSRNDFCRGKLIDLGKLSYRVVPGPNIARPGKTSSTIFPPSIRTVPPTTRYCTPTLGSIGFSKVARSLIV
jgi:hypothetical protein